MKVVSVINYKGGVGKTSLAYNLSAELANAGKRVLVIDVDPQASLTFLFFSNGEYSRYAQTQKTFKAWVEPIIASRPAPSFKSIIVSMEGVDIICSHLSLINTEMAWSQKLPAVKSENGGFNYVHTLSMLKREIDTLRADYDVIMIDCPPNFNILTRNAIIASDYYLVPSKMDYLSTLGISYLQGNVEDLTEEYNSFAPEKVLPEMLGIVATMVGITSGKPIASNAQQIAILKRQYPFFDTALRESKTIYGRAGEHIPVVKQKVTTANAEVIAELKALTAEFVAKTGI